MGRPAAARPRRSRTGAEGRVGHSGQPTPGARTKQGPCLPCMKRGFRRRRAWRQPAQRTGADTTFGLSQTVALLGGARDEQLALLRDEAALNPRGPVVFVDDTELGEAAGEFGEVGDDACAVMWVRARGFGT